MRVPRKTADEAKALAAKLPGITAGQVLAEAHDLQLLVVAALHELGAVGSDGLNLTAHRLLESHTEAVLTRRRDLIVSGESLHVIDVGTDGLKLLPVGDHDVSGTSPDPSEWIYRVSLHGPDASVSRSIPAAGVVHIRYSADPARPWRGVGPRPDLRGRACRQAEPAGAVNGLRGALRQRHRRQGVRLQAVDRGRDIC